MTWSVVYFNDRVKREVFELPDDILASYLRLVGIMEEFGADLRMPHSRAMGDGLFELRPRGQEGIGRVFYCMHVDRQVVVLHSFVKKTQETPQGELRTALKRLKEVRNG
jgi:phage-related protein